ncbi:MAG: elongation factor P--(R)-beta-lysine ligase [Sphaerochaetaceae bacterium]|nr:elongation factor P--(R)-beta-lysine ligase [Sphaerochaetaceae bacterium]
MKHIDKLKAAKNRSTLYSNIRNFFNQKNYLEVETPSLSPTLIPESTIENFSTQFTSEFLPSKELYLIPSPEIFMKQLISEGFPSIYQFSKCFRNSEQIGKQHNIEFTMLEYYSINMDEQDSIELTSEMISKTHLKDCPSWALPPFRKMSVNDAMKQYCDVDLEKCQKQSLLYEKAIKLGLSNVKRNESWESTFNRIFLTFVEPNLPQDKPLILDNYPKQIDCLATNDKSSPFKKRWEMYIGGLEVANCYDELKDKEKVEEYYKKEYSTLIRERSLTNRVIPDIDHEYHEIFNSFPQTSGVAIGMDRLLMSQMNIDNIEGVILFPFSDIIR